MEAKDYLVGVFTTDRNLVITFWSRWLEEVTGIPAVEAEGKLLEELIPEIKERGIAKYIEEVLKEGKPRVLSSTFHKYLIPAKPTYPSKYFDKMQQLVTIAPLIDNNSIVGIIVTIEDVTRRLEEEKEILELLRSPNEKTRLKATKLLAERGNKENLIEAFSDNSWRVRMSAINELKRTRDRELVLNLLKRMKEEHNNISVLNSILQVLSSTDVDIVDSLEELLVDPDPDIRIYTTLLLGDMKDPRAEDLLIKALSDPNPNVKFNAIESLGKLKSEKAIPYLIKFIEERDFSLAFPAIEALKNIGNSVIINKLYPFLEDEFLSSSIIEALGILGDESSITPLTELLNKDERNIDIIVNSIAQIYYRYRNIYGEGEHIKDIFKSRIKPSGIQNLINYLARAEEGNLKELVLVLGWIENSVVERALTRLIGNPEIRNEIIEIIVRYGEHIIPVLIEKLRDEDIETRFSAIVALGRIGDPTAVPYLVEVLLNDRELSAVSAGALAKIGDRKAFEPLLSMLGDTDPTIRQAVISALNSLGHPEMPKRIKELLKSNNRFERESAVKIAGYFGYEDCKEMIFELCTDEEEDVRKAVYENLVFFEDQRIPSILSSGLEKESRKVKEAIARSIAYLEDRYILPVLEKALSDNDPWVRYYAVKSLKYHKIPDMLDILLNLLNRDPSNLVKIGIIEVLGEIGNGSIINHITPILRSKDEDLVRSTIVALGKIEHPNAIPPLLEILKTSNDKITKIEAIRALGNKSGIGVVETLQWIVATENTQEIINEALESLAKISTKESIKAILSLTIDSTKKERCISILSKLPIDKIDYLLEDIDKMPKLIKSSVILALERMKSYDAMERILRFLEDRDPEIRIQVINSIKNLGSIEGKRRLLEHIDKENDPTVKDMIYNLLKGR